MAKPSYQMLGILSGDREMALPPSTEINELNFVVKKSTIMMPCSGVSISYENRREIKCRPRLRIKSSLITRILRRQRRCAGRE